MSGGVVAAFDFDGTLTNGGSVWRFLVAVAGPWAVARAAIVLLPRLVAAALFGGRYADAAKEALFVRTLGDRDASDVARVALSFGPRHYRRHARAEMAARLRRHVELGHRVVIVSASPELYVRPVAEELGVQGVVATRLAVDHRDPGRLTGHYEGANCRGREKVDRVRAWIAQEAATGEAATGEAAPGGSPLLWAYGNSAGDRRLLSEADIGVDVGRLGRFGRLRGFPRLDQVPGPEGAAAPVKRRG